MPRSNDDNKKADKQKQEVKHRKSKGETVKIIQDKKIIIKKATNDESGEAETVKLSAVAARGRSEELEGHNMLKR